MITILSWIGIVYMVGVIIALVPISGFVRTYYPRKPYIMRSLMACRLAFGWPIILGMAIFKSPNEEGRT